MNLIDKNITNSAIASSSIQILKKPPKQSDYPDYPLQAVIRYVKPTSQ